MISLCKHCGKKIEESKKRKGRKKIFCNFRCCGRYHAMQKYIKNGRKKIFNTPEEREKYNLWQNNYYYKNKNKRICNSLTYNLLVSKPELIKKECKICKVKENLEIHHEEYDPTIEGIKRLLIEKKIYFLCFKHHKKHHKENRIYKNGINNSIHGHYSEVLREEGKRLQESYNKILREKITWLESTKIIAERSKNTSWDEKKLRDVLRNIRLYK